MSQLNAERKTLEVLAEEFVVRYRRGERPGLSEYIEGHPELADEIRELFPTLVMMEELAPSGSDASLSPTVAAAEPPRLSLGDYRILREIGRGGMGGIVYEAEQLSLGRRVALKVLRHTAVDATVRQRFHREARAAAQLHHTNIVPVFEVGEDQDTCWYAMQLILGHGLDQIIEELRQQRLAASRRVLKSVPQVSQVTQSLLSGQFACPGLTPSMPPTPPHPNPPPQGGSEPLSPSPLVGEGWGGGEQASLDSADSARLAGHSELSVSDSTGGQYYRSVARIGRQAAEGLAHAHARGIIHRDIKPSNLLLDTAGVVWITDFGLAKTQDVALTTTGDIVGTLRYMAPERLRGESDERGDVYALGLTLYELLVLRPALESHDRLRLVDRIKNEEPARPRSLDRRIPRDLETIVLKAIHKEPKRRYQTAEAMAEDLRRFLDNEPIKAKRATQLERLRLWSRRNPALAALLVVLALSAAGAATTAFYLRVMLEESKTAHRQARLHEANALVGQAHGTRLSRRPGQRFEALDALGKAAAIGRELDQPPEWFDRLRHEAVAALALPDVHITHEFGSFPPGSRWVELNEDFTLYARTTDKGGCTIRRVDDDTEVARLPQLGEPAEASFGLGRILAVRGSSGRFQLWELNGAEPALRFEAPGIGREYRFHNDSRLLALPHLDGSISVYETASGKRVHQLAPGQIVQDLHAYLHPTAPFVACSSYHSRDVQVRNLKSGAVVATAMPPWPLGSYACWSPDGHTLLVAEANGGMIQEHAFDSASPALRLTRSIQGPSMGHATFTFNPTGDRFVRRGWENVVVLFDAASGQELFRTHALTSASNCRLLRFDQTGQRLAGALVGDRTDRIGLWSVADGREYLSLTKLGNAIGAASIHPGGRLAAVGSTDGVVLFDLETGRILDCLAISKRIRSVSFDGTGSLLTNGFEGFFRWPVRADAAKPGRLTVGPPERLPFHPGDIAIAASRDGRVIAQCMWNGYGMSQFAGGWILHPNSRTPRRVEAGTTMNKCSVSPDGRWVAFGGPHLLAGRAAINVYETATARRVWQSPAEVGSGLFSPDGRWLVTDTDGGRSYAVGTWEPGPLLGPGTPFQVTAHLAVFGQTNGIYRLVELATGRELARLEDPELNNGAAALAPDGTKLVVHAKDGLRVWDLRRIRTELATLGLDWDSPPLPVAGGAEAVPLSIHTELGDTLQWAKAVSLVRQANQHTGAKEHAKALEALRQAVTMAPACASAHNNLAWLLLTGPKHLRDPSKALIEAKRAVEVEPGQALYLNTLGVALYYTEHYADAIPVLERSLREQKGQADAFDFFFLAMCHHRLGDAAKAKDCHQRGSQWLQKNKGKFSTAWLEELTAFRAEADAVLAQPPGQVKK